MSSKNVTSSDDWGCSLIRGDIVVARQPVDPVAANAQVGDLGVVFEPANYYGDGGGPMVRWFSGGALVMFIRKM